MTFRHILVAHDFSDPANRTLLFASRLATRLGSQLHLIHVHPDYEAPSANGPGVPWPSADQTERYVRFLQEELRRTAQAVVPELADKITYHVVRGDPVKGIETAAERVGAELICVGSTGKGAVERVLLGSIAQRILRSSKVPVLTIH
jgi:nucleotide-binding universal stress UspA family protein